MGTGLRFVVMRHMYQFVMYNFYLNFNLKSFFRMTVDELKNKIKIVFGEN